MNERLFDIKIQKDIPLCYNYHIILLYSIIIYSFFFIFENEIHLRSLYVLYVYHRKKLYCIIYLFISNFHKDKTFFF